MYVSLLFICYTHAQYNATVRWKHTQTHTPYGYQSVLVSVHVYVWIFFSMALVAQSRAMASSFLSFFRDHTQRHTTVCRTPLEGWSARHRDLYLTTHNTHNRQTSMPPAGFEPTISAGERPQTYALDRAATGTGVYIWISICLFICVSNLGNLIYTICQIDII